jgi:hypothetical protein
MNLLCCNAHIYDKFIVWVECMTASYKPLRRYVEGETIKTTLRSN